MQQAGGCEEVPCVGEISCNGPGREWANALALFLAEEKREQQLLTILT